MKYCNILFRDMLNGLKRREEDAAKDLKVSLDEIQAILKGGQDPSREIIEKACEVWPVNQRDFYGIEDDTECGHRKMSFDESKSSSRVMERKGSPYYEYRDTACSSISSFRPEWIKQLAEVTDLDPENPTVRWNHGHFLHQFTYFIGPVNFYYHDDQGRRQVQAMKTGDSMYITPFVPHSFARRKEEEGEAIILALTYGHSLLGDAQHELQHLAEGSFVNNYLLDFKNKNRAIASAIKFYANCLSLDINQLVQSCGLDEKVFKSEHSWQFEELDKVAQVLGVNACDLWVIDEEQEKVIIKKINETKKWSKITESGEYLIRELASTKLLPMCKSLEITVHNPFTKDDDFSFNLHQYIYNIGTEKVVIKYRLQDKSLSVDLLPDESIFLKPGVPHSFEGQNGKVISLRIPGKISPDRQKEMSSIGQENIARIIHDSSKWFSE